MVGKILFVKINWVLILFIHLAKAYIKFEHFDDLPSSQKIVQRCKVTKNNIIIGCRLLWLSSRHFCSKSSAQSFQGAKHFQSHKVTWLCKSKWVWNCFILVEFVVKANIMHSWWAFYPLTLLMIRHMLFKWACKCLYVLNDTCKDLVIYMVL